MPKVRTNRDRPLEIRYEPGSALRTEGAQVEVLKVTPEGTDLTEDQARVVLSLYHECRVVPGPSAPIAVVIDTLTCEEHDKEYKTQQGYDNHIESYH